MTPPNATVHFTRMVARGETGSLQGQEERNRSQIAHLPENVALLSMVKPDVIVLAHTATSYTLGKAAEETSGQAALRVQRHSVHHGVRQRRPGA